MRKPKLYIVGWRDGSFSDPVTWREAQEMKRQTRENLEENISITRYDESDGNREYRIQYAHACGYKD